MKITTLIFSLSVLVSWNMGVTHGKVSPVSSFQKIDTTGVTYTVSVPEGTHGCFIAGEMNGWIPHEMKRLNATDYILSIQDANVSQPYKYLSGPTWDYVEKNAEGTDMSNRSYHEHDVVAKWAKVWNPSENIPPKVPSGKVERLFFKSKYVDARNIDVWLPDGYSSKKKYAVLYMQDGQNIFGAATTWNHQSWQIANTLSRLIKEDSVENTIVVGIWNNGNQRVAEYYPQKAFNDIAEPYKDSLLAWMPGGPDGDNYLKFIVKELKPFIDSTFSVYTDRSHTFLMGSSYGGLISLYAICEYPQVFGGAACMSTHWIGLFNPNNAIPDAIENYLRKHLPSPEDHKIYFDYGSKTLDRFYGPYQKQVNVIMKEKGYAAKDWETKYFPGADHSEKSWAKRVHIPLIFLLGNNHE